MDYKDINDKWKHFLAENAFKEDKLINGTKKKKRRKDKKELITSESDESSQDELDEMSGAGAVVGYSAPLDKNSEEE
jgi:hypothetical protein